MLERIERTHDEAAKTMWYIAFTDTLLDLLPTKGSFSYEELQAELQARLERSGDDNVLKHAYREALVRLAEHRPR